MDKQKSTITAAGGLSTKAVTTNHAAVLPQPVRRVLQNFLLIRLDANFDESKDHYNKSIQDLQHIVATITTFTDVDQCVDFLSDIEDEKVWMIVSNALGQHIVPEIQALSQLHSIYVFCDNQSIHQQWAKTIPKAKEHGRSSFSVESQRDRDSSLFVVEPERGSSSAVPAEPQHGSSSSSVAPQQNSSLFLVEPERGSSSSVEPERGSSSSIVGAKLTLYSHENNIIVLQTIFLSSSSTTLSVNPDCEIINEGVKKQALPSARTKHRSQYLHEWEKKPEPHFKTYIYDDFGCKHERFMCWLYFDNNSMFCRLCQKFGKYRNVNAHSPPAVDETILNLETIISSQSLLAYLQEAATDVALSISERESAKDLLKSILNDDFLLALHFQYDLPETILESWTCEFSSTVGPALFDYLQSTAEESFGSFRVTVGDRKMHLNNCLEHIHRLLQELDKRFTPSRLQECLSILFDPQYLIKNKRNISCLDYGRSELDFLRQKYNKFPNFDSNIVRNEWESLKQPLSYFANTFSTVQSTQTFWKDFIALKVTTTSNFLSQHKNILLLLNIYLISPTNSAECERGFSAANRIQATGRSRLKISTLDILMTIRMLLKDDLRSSRCQEVVNKTFESWSDLNHNRRLHQIQLLLDTSDDYTPTNQVRSVSKRSRDYLQLEFIENKKKKNQSANGCKRETSGTDPSENEAILCYHQNEQFQWIDLDENYSRWLCNYCRIKLAIAEDPVWFCDDHVDMHREEDENENFD
ncbi:unnamed protein product [Rotaria sordida]|uniref:HAT C-terminal dimerisation domain-containing protein n=1 Tax=Rotaria sordida TaxID=392033 RepID=A0A815CD62_9BILA|nr:unnamed protein product [Rotaria sordida]CAF4104334.1 unnamed protein product [Rotaria sordida]